MFEHVIGTNPEARNEDRLTGMKFRMILHWNKQELVNFPECREL